MNNKKLKLVVFSLLFIFTSFWVCFDSVYALPKVESKKVIVNNGYAKIHLTNISNTANSGFAYCNNRDIKGPDVGATASSKSTTITKGPQLCILNNGAPSGTPTDIQYVTTQIALWRYQSLYVSGRKPYNLSGIIAGQTVAKNAQALVDKCKNNSSYKVNPSISISSMSTPTLSGNNYVSTLKVSKSDVSSYSVALSGVSGATYSKSGDTVTIKFPVPKTTDTLKLTAKVSASGIYKYVDVYNYGTRQPIAILMSTTKNVNDSKTVSVTPGFVKVYKVDQDNDKKFLAGATYQLYKGTGCTTEVPGFTTPKTTDSKGVVEFIGLEPGTYSVKETAAPAGYGAPTTSCQTAKTGGSVTFKNKRNFVKLVKVDTEGRKLPGATFGLYTNATCTTRAVSALTGKEFSFANTDSNGVVTFEGMASTTKNYYLKEETPPNGYFKLKDSENCKPVKVNGSVTFTNTKISTSQVAVQKRDGFTKFGMNGVKIGLFDDSACNNKIAEAVTSSGQVQFKFEYDESNTPTFYTKELEVPDGYVPEKGKGNTECKKIDVGTTHSVVIYNYPYGDIKLLKLEYKTEKPLKGIEFALTDEKGNKVKDINGKEVANAVTNAEGYVEFKDVLYGTYFIKEVKSDGKHKMLKDPIMIMLNSDNDAAKLAGRSDVKYYRGDLNSDRFINADDLLIYQNLISNPDQMAALSPEASYALDVNGDGNASASDLSTDMNIVDYYISFVNNEDSSVLSAARNYTTYKDRFCSTLNGATCTLTGLNKILDMYNTNKTVLQQYQTAQTAANDAATTANAQAQQEYQAALAEYNTRCPLGPNTPLPSDGSSTQSSSDPADGTNPTDGTEPVAPSEPQLDPECATPPTLHTVEPENVCPNYTNSIVGDVNHDCKVNQLDVTALPSSNVDLNGDGNTNDADVSILTRYIDYTGSANNEEIYSAITTFLNNKTVLCGALGKETCSINETYLTSALTDVGKSGILPSNIARASTTAINDLIYLNISKQTITKAKELPGATIVIRDEKGNKVLEYKSTKKPKHFTIAAGKYTLTEKIAPKGYDALETTVKFEVLDDGNTKLLGATSNMYKVKKGTDGYIDHLIIYNKPNKDVPVPDTGSNVAVVSIISGFVLVVCGGFIIYKRLI